VEPSVNGVTVEEVTAVTACPVVGTVVSADAKLPTANTAARANTVARARTDVYKKFMTTHFLLLEVIGHLFSKVVVNRKLTISYIAILG